METNGMFSNNSSGSGMLGLEMSLNHHHHHPQPQQQTNNFLHQQPPFAGEENPSTTEDSGGGDGKMRKGSPWQRMKWTDNMVRLLIMVVFYIGDEVSSDQPPGSDTTVKKKSGGGGGGGGGGGLQKKGKWKSVSRAMMERGFYVSPQQCEDKFNDLNKRYKRVNDILGKGTACKVVENQSLLETMDHISPKLKEEAKKLLNSKHLFFREMCAYHNSCAGVGGATGATHAAGGSGGSGVNVAHHSSPPEVTNTELSRQRQICVHSNGNDDEEDEEDGEEEEEEGDGDEEDDEGLSSRKRGRIAENDGHDGYESIIHQFNGEMSLVIQDITKSVWEKKQWMKAKTMQLEEQRLGFQGQTYELEKQRLKWLKFSCKKEREMEMDKLRNERMKLENERMVLMLRQKEMELVDHQQQFSSNGYKRTSD